MKNNIVLLCLLFHLCSCSVIKKDEPSQVVLEGLGESIKISTSNDKKIFPKEWLLSSINAKAQSLDEGEFQRCRKIILSGLEKYPSELVLKNLKSVYLLRYLEYFGIEAGGTNSLSSVYLISKGKAKGFTDFWVEKTFHAEFSSILLRNYTTLFDEEKWKEINGLKVHYGRGGVEAIGEKKMDKTFDFVLNEIGFLHEYGKSSLENDFNAFVEQLFMGNKNFWQRVNTYPKLNKKLEMVIGFYQHIHPSFTIEYFRSLVQ